MTRPLSPCFEAVKYMINQAQKENNPDQRMITLNETDNLLHWAVEDEQFQKSKETKETKEAKELPNAPFVTAAVAQKIIQDSKFDGKRQVVKTYDHSLDAQNYQSSTNNGVKPGQAKPLSIKGKTKNGLKNSDRLEKSSSSKKVKLINSAKRHYALKPCKHCKDDFTPTSPSQVYCLNPCNPRKPFTLVAKPEAPALSPLMEAPQSTEQTGYKVDYDPAFFIDPNETEKAKEQPTEQFLD